MEIIKMLNIGIRFLLELCLLTILGYWGFKTAGNIFSFKPVVSNH